MASAYDFSRVPGPGAQEIIDHDGKGVLVYSGNARQSDKLLDEYRDAGLKVVWIWEENTDSIFTRDGADACKVHERRAEPGELTYVACDTRTLGDTTRFLGEWSGATREDEFGIYGPDFAIAQAQSLQSNKCKKWWGVVNWIVGGYSNNDQRNIDWWTKVGAHIIQLIGSPIADTDQNLIVKDDWWKIGSTPKPVVPETKEDNVVRIQLGDFVHFLWVEGTQLITRALELPRSSYTPKKIIFDGMVSEQLDAWNTGFGWQVTGAAKDGQLVIANVPTIKGWEAHTV